jgi:hypothetical protein
MVVSETLVTFRARKHRRRWGREANRLAPITTTLLRKLHQFLQSLIPSMTL